MDRYEGHVEPGGAWIERRDGPLLIRKLSVGAMDNNVYIVADTAAGDAFVVDAPTDPARIRAAAADVDVLGVLITHGHADHVGAWPTLQDEDDLPVHAHADDRDRYPAEPDHLLRHEDRIPVGSLALEVLHTPGHTDGGVMFLVEGDERPHLFTGDALFPGGLGRTTSPDHFEQLYRSVIREVFDRLPDETWMYPGHGDDTTLGAQRPQLGAWYERKW
ncbi:MAG: MBL fold metallo-hydrolase [Actinobacteria bacterium]|nr:MBL fold metallo-hydrolase [Actinomycetota bacterium]